MNEKGSEGQEVGVAEMTEKTGKPKKLLGGPYLQAALICEKVLIEQDGVKSAIRMVDRVTRTVASPAPPEDMPPFNFEFVLLLKFKAGRARGVHAVKLQPVKPSGEFMPPLINNVFFEGEDDRGVDIVTPTVFSLDQSGTYWIRVYLDDDEVTRIPFKVIYMPQVIPPRPSQDKRSE